MFSSYAYNLYTINSLCLLMTDNIDYYAEKSLILMPFYREIRVKIRIIKINNIRINFIV